MAWHYDTLQYEHGPNGRVQCRIVYKRSPAADQWDPWVIIAPSSIMARQNPPITGWGLYAARRFEINRHHMPPLFIGRYEGQVIRNQDEGTMRFPSRHAACSSYEAHILHYYGDDYLISRQIPHAQGRGYELVSGAPQFERPPFLNRINDPRGTSSPPNVAFTDGGWARLERQIGAFDANLPINHPTNMQAEICVAYGDTYWVNHGIRARGEVENVTKHGISIKDKFPGDFYGPNQRGPTPGPSLRVG